MGKLNYHLKNKKTIKDWTFGLQKNPKRQDEKTIKLSFKK
jgi:hypothetical protein